MTTHTKQHYSISEVSQMLEVPIYTLRFWEREIPMFKPNRSAKGRRCFTPADIDMAKAIKAAVYDKGLKIEGAIEYLNKTYRKQPLRRPYKCETSEAAVALLGEVMSALSNAHVIAKTQAVIDFLRASNGRH